VTAKPSLRAEINHKILAYEQALDMLGKHETVARGILNYARNEMLEVLERVDREPLRRAA
jgi:hypothetical protein